MKIVKAFQQSGLLIKSVSKTVENDVKEQKGRFLGMLADILGSGLLENMLSGEGVVRGDGVIWANEEAKAKNQGRGVIRASEGQDFWCCLIL